MRHIMTYLPDLLWVAGAVELYRGLYAWQPPAADIAVGVLLLFTAWRLARREGSQ